MLLSKHIIYKTKVKATTFSICRTTKLECLSLKIAVECILVDLWEKETKFPLNCLTIRIL